MSNNFENIKEDTHLLKLENEKLDNKIKNNISIQEHYRELSKEREKKVIFK